MKLSKRDFTGTGEVFDFTLRQYAKSKANIISGCVMLILVLISMPVVALLAKNGTISLGGDLFTSTSNAETVYIQNETFLSFDAPKGSYWSKTDFRPASSDAMELGEKDALAVITEDPDGSYALQVGGGTESELSAGDLQDLSDRLQKTVTESAALAAGVTREQLAMADADYSVKSGEAASYAAPGEPLVDEEGPGGRFALQYGYAIVVMMLCMISTAYIIRAVIEEKSSKLVELLMISVKPMALLTGKILAVMTYIFGLMIAMLGAFVLSGFAASLLFDFSAASLLQGQLQAVAPQMHFDVLEIIGVLAIALVSLALGYLTFSIIGGISGACCSGTEDMESANGSVVMLVMLGYIASCFGGIFNSTALATVLSLFPVVSVFCAPVEYVTGRIGLPVLALSWVIQVAVICLLMVFASRVYADIVIHRGSRIKLRQLLGMAGTKRRAA
ncbi:MAG: ABC transporter permease [Clostridiales bacterium]|nr:ABC transporter permease [Clostridiales bacterium]